MRQRENAMRRLDGEPSPRYTAAAWAAGAVITGLLGAGLFRLYRWVEENTESDASGYVDGQPVSLRVVRIDGKPVEVNTAAAFKAMRSYAANEDGIRLRVNSGFRTIEEQRYFHNCYTTCSCNDCHYAERPGYSQHQSGRALDLNTSDEKVYQWLRRRARWFGFEETVQDEPWHWEFVM